MSHDWARSLSEFAKPHIREQMIDLALIEDEFPELRLLLSLRRVALVAQLEVLQNPKKGSKLDLNDSSTITLLEVEARCSRKPIAHLLDISLFEKDSLVQMCEGILRGFCVQGVAIESFRLLDELKMRPVEEIRWLDDALKGNTDGFEAEGERMGIDTSLLFFVASMLVQPLLEEVARRVNSTYLEEWHESRCPVCSRQPSVARRRGGKRYLNCVFCGADYLFDSFTCAHCGNRDPYTLKFIVDEDLPGFEIDFCEKCHSYLKVIDEEKVQNRLPRGLEGLLTYRLDQLAAVAGLAKRRPSGTLAGLGNI